MKKPFSYNNTNQLRDNIKKYIESKNKNFTKENVNVNFIEDTILVKPIDYYYTNAITRSSKVMNDCRKISKKFLFTGIEKAS